MKNKKKVAIAIAMVFVVVCIILLIKNKINNESFNKDISEETMESETKEGIRHNRKGVDMKGVSWEIADLIGQRVPWEKISLSSKFRNKYKTVYDIFPEADNILIIGSGGFDDDTDIACIDVHWKSANKSEYAFSPETFFYYKCYINEDRELDDIEFVSRKEIIDENGNILEDFSDYYEP